MPNKSRSRSCFLIDEGSIIRSYTVFPTVSVTVRRSPEMRRRYGTVDVLSLSPVAFAGAVSLSGVAEEEPGKIDRERVEACLKTAGLWDKIASLPKGMDSEYSRAVNDEGTELSGGQIQKLLLARALYRKAPIMILDEPTAALDPIAESNLYETYHAVMKDCSTVFISHRLASTRFCDRIVLMEDGKIIEEGTHSELLAKQGRYYELYETQAKYYRETLIEVEGGASE